MCQPVDDMGGMMNDNGSLDSSWILTIGFVKVLTVLENFKEPSKKFATKLPMCKSYQQWKKEVIVMVMIMENDWCWMISNWIAGSFLRRPGIEPGSTAWKAAMLTIVTIIADH